MGTILEVSLLLVCIAFVCLGFWGRQSMLNKNPCQMTYTSYEKAFVEVSSSVPGVGELYRHPAKGKLNPQPVLFIHGHMGSSDQVRSLSSPMHNEDNYFQYFAVSFKDKIGSAVHGASLLTQAAFVNDALRTILDLYDSSAASASPSQGKRRPVKVMLVGHSMGGMVARTAVLMSNHPHTNAAASSGDGNLPLTASCAVSDIIMLSTPNRAPSYSLDGSIQEVYQLVNRGWQSSHFNTSKECLRAQSKMRTELSSRTQSGASPRGSADDNVCVSNNNTRRNEKVRLDAPCSVCAPQIRLLSVTGGGVDMHVPAHLTTLENLAPHIRNTTAEELTLAEQSGQSGVLSNFLKAFGLNWTLGAVKAITNMANPFFIFVYLRDSLFSVVHSLKGQLTSANLQPVETAVVVGADSDSDSVPVPVLPASSETLGTAADEFEFKAPVPSLPAVLVDPPDYSNYTYGHLLRLDQPTWDQHISPYVDSQHFNVRAMQVKGCGFLVDHMAILWCRQLIHSVSDAMRILSRNPSDLEDSRIAKFASGDGVAAAAAAAANTYTDARGRIKWEEVLAGRKNSSSHKFFADAAAEASLMIPPVASFHLKNVSHHAFNHIAPVEELRYMAGKLNGAVQAFAVWYVSNHLGSILAAYVFIGIMVLCVPLRRRVTNFKSTNAQLSTSDFSALRMSAHMHLEDVVPFVSMIAAPVLGAILPDSIINSSLGQLLAKMVAPSSGSPPGGIVDRIAPLAVLLLAAGLKLAYVDYYTRGSRSLSKVLFDHQELLFAVVSYGAAVVLRFLLSAVLYGVRFSLGGLWSLLYYVLYKKIVPKFLRTRIASLCRRLMLPRASILFSSAVCVAGTLVFFTYGRVMSEGAVGRGHYLVCVLTVGVVTSGVLALLWALVFPLGGAAELDHLQTALALLYLPLVVLAAPCTIYSVRLLLDHPDMFANVSGAFEVFGAERLNALVAAFGIFLHWVVMWGWSTKYASTADVPAVSWIVAIFGRPAAARATSIDDVLGSTTSSSSDCFHEDAGKHGIFEEVTAAAPAAAPAAVPASAPVSDTATPQVAPPRTSDQRIKAAGGAVEVSRGVLLGPTFRAVYCACYKDKREIADWCEFCRCPRCGVKNLPADYKPDTDYADEASSAFRPSVKTQYEYSANHILLAALLALAYRGVAHYQHLPHQQFMLMGGVAWCFLLRDYLVFWRIFQA